MSERDDALRMIKVPVVLMEPEKIDAVLFATKALADFGERFGWTDEALAAYEQLQSFGGTPSITAWEPPTLLRTANEPKRTSKRTMNDAPDEKKRKPRGLPGKPQNAIAVG